MVRRDPDATRQTILEAASAEIHRVGFRSASVDRILADTGLTKGAFYHHFATKNELGYAVVDEVIKAQMFRRWVDPLAEFENPIEGLVHIFDNIPPRDMEMGCKHGCPLNNLAQEMSGVDETFQKKLQAVYDQWRQTLAEALIRGQGAGHVRSDVDCHKVAAFIVASFEGAIGMAKSAQDPYPLEAFRDGLTHYLLSLRAGVPAPTV